jgi:FkbM family methyltransferase
MSLRLAVRRLIPQSVKNFFRQRGLSWRLSRLLSPFLPQLVCVDVGASYFPHGKWLLFLNAPKTQWLAVEPNAANIEYAKSWRWACEITTCTTGLSRDGGMQTLYITNVDSGSSLLPPEIPSSMKHRVSNIDYFFPVKEKSINTLKLVQALDGMSDTAPVFVKLDTQGTELSILQGAQVLLDARRIVGIEMESTLLAQPVMKGSGKFWEACEYLEGQGFELVHLKPITAVSQTGKNTFLNECDAVFALRNDIVAQLPVEYRVSLIVFYLVNLLYEEALSMLLRDDGAAEFLQRQGCPLKELIHHLRKAV